MNVLQPWIIAAIVVASWNWRIVFRVFDRVIWFPLGWRDTLTDESDYEQRSIFIEVLRWVVTAVFFYVALYLLKPSQNAVASIWILLFWAVNLASYTAAPVLREWLANADSSYSGRKTYKGLDRIKELGYFVSVFCMVFGSFLWHFIPATFAERSFVYSQTTTIVDDGEVSAKRISVAQVDEILRDGTTWFEIRANWEDGVVYQVREHPDHNAKLKHLASIADPRVTRDNLLEIRWSSDSKQVTPLGKLLLEADVEPSVVVLAQVVTLD